ncbi:MAG: hypothetical protein IT562_13530 [Alphaproteobacteria bacterium]|nr:hypothetical protein [Alphaproteobacteria bacterium]
MAQQQSQDRRSGGNGRDAANAAALVRLGRIAREGLGRAANDNHARNWSRTAGAALIAAAAAVFSYAVLRWMI